MRQFVRVMLVNKESGVVIKTYNGIRISTHEQISFSGAFEGISMEYHQVRLETGKVIDIPSRECRIAKDGVLEYYRLI